MDQGQRTAVVRIDTACIGHNVRQFRRHVHSDCFLLAVVKADGYGHGDLQTARIALANGANWLGVAAAEEGLRLRRAGIASPILVLGASSPEKLELCVGKDLCITVYDWQSVQYVSKVARRLSKTARVHVKVDTGMGRFGIAPQDAVSFIKQVNGLPSVDAQGVFTHFASAEEYHGEYFHWQWQRFQSLLRELRHNGIRVPIKHAANTAAALFCPDTHLDMVRVGLGIYGLYPNKERPLELKQAFSLVAEVVAVRRIPPGTGISYGSTHVTWKETTVAVIGIGYADGVSRALGNKGCVIIGGKRFSLVGAICMDYCMVDVGDYEVSVGERVVLLGSAEDQMIQIDEWADWIGTINYEIPCMISSHVGRQFV